MMRSPNLDVADCSPHHLSKRGKVKENYNQNMISKFEMALNWSWFFQNRIMLLGSQLRSQINDTGKQGLSVEAPESLSSAKG